LHDVKLNAGNNLSTNHSEFVLLLFHSVITENVMVTDIKILAGE